MNTIRYGQSLLAMHGLPFDIFCSHIWNKYTLSDLKGYDADAKGHQTLVESVQAGQFITNDNQVLLFYQIKKNRKVRTDNFTIVGCD